MQLGKSLSWIASAATALVVAPARASTISLISGQSGTFFPSQSFNETRGVDVTVVSGPGVNVRAMTVDGLSIGAATSALVGARIYKSSSGSLMASANATVTAGGSVTVPIAAHLAPGGTFRLAFYVSTTPVTLGSATLFDPDPVGVGGIPYIEASGQMQINSAHQIGSDSFPSNVSSSRLVQIELTVDPALGTAFCFGDGTLSTPCPCVAPHTVPTPSGAFGRGCANSFDLHGALLTATGSTLPDTVAFTGTIGPSYSAFGFLVKGTASNPSGAALSDGVSCFTGALVRFGGHNAGTNGAPLGSWTYPNTAQTLSVSTATAQGPSQHAYYQLYYRNAAANFCTSFTANLSNGVDITWP